ncbi:hypothetical protein ACJX0J_016613, partial [Zea mays]
MNFCSKIFISGDAGLRCILVSGDAITSLSNCHTTVPWLRVLCMALIVAEEDNLKIAQAGYGYGSTLHVFMFLYLVVSEPKSYAQKLYFLVFF